MKNVKEALYELKIFSEFVVVLGYAAILQNDIDIAIEAQYVKDKIRSLSYDMRIATIYAVRSTRDSSKEISQLASLLQVGVAAKEISDGIDDLVEIVIRGGGAHPLLRSIYGMEKFVVKIEIHEDSKMLGKRFSSLGIEDYDFEILFIRRGKEYIINEEIDNTYIKKGDVILMRGSEEKSKEIKKIFL
jgi:uncharacterized protein with PhoU and TrkA domain